MTPWIITGLLAVIVAWIIYTEMKCGRKSKAFLAQANKEIDTLQRNATVAYRAKFGRDPTAPFGVPTVGDDPKVSSKRS
jgi:hypothetical protein